MYNFCFISGCAARGDRHGHLKDSSEENSRRKVSQVLHVLKCYNIWNTMAPSVQWLFKYLRLGKQLFKYRLPAFPYTPYCVHTCTHTWLKQTPGVPSSKGAQWGSLVPDCRSISGRWFPSPPRIWPCGLWGCETKVIYRRRVKEWGRGVYEWESEKNS